MSDYMEHDDPIICSECGRVIESGEYYLDIGEGAVCENCEYDYLKQYRREVQIVLG